MKIKKLQNQELMESLKQKLEHLVKFRIRGITESGGYILIEQHQLNDIGYEITIKPINKVMNVPKTPLKRTTRKINCYDLKTGKYMQTFNSLFDAQYVGTDRRYNTNNIACCCNGKNKKTVDMIFLYENESEKIDLTDEFYKNRFGYTIEQYNSIVINKKNKN